VGIAGYIQGGAFLGGQILGSGESLSKWLKNWTEIKDMSGERRTEEK